MAVLRLELQDITKVYPGVRANDGVCLQVGAGEIHAVLGENGAGKSTLMKIIYGVTQPDSGQMSWDGQLVRVRSPEQARKLGIAMVFQHFSLFETLTVAENVWLGLAEKSKARVRLPGSISRKAPPRRTSVGLPSSALSARTEPGESSSSPETASRSLRAPGKRRAT